MPRKANPARTEARKHKRPHYEGLPCPEGHTRRHTASGACVECQAEKQRQRRAAKRAPMVELADMFA